MTLDADYTGVAARNLQRIALNERIILFIDPATRRKIGRTDELEKGCRIVFHLRHIAGRERRVLARLHPWTIIFRRFVAQILDRQVGDFLALMNNAETQIVGRLAKSRPHLRKMACACVSFSGFRTMSMRSWLSDSIIS